MELVKKFKINEQAYIEYCAKVTASRNYLTVAVTSIILIVMSVFLKNDGASMWQSVLTGAIIAAVYAVLIIFVSKLTIKNGARKAYTRRNLNTYRILLRINEKGIFQKMGKNQPDLNVEWSKFKKIVETELSFAFYISMNNAILACKEGLTKEEVALLREIIATYSNCKKLKLKEREPERARLVPPTDIIWENEDMSQEAQNPASQPQPVEEKKDKNTPFK